MNGVVIRDVTDADRRAIRTRGSIFEVNWDGKRVRRRVVDTGVDFVVMEIVDGRCLGRMVLLELDEIEVYLGVATTIGVKSVQRRTSKPTV